ncbi:MAG: hypothetical protein WC891_07355 [Actinomycetota bacterium]
MKTGAKVGIAIAVILVLLLCCCAGSAGGWFFILGPGAWQTAQANTLVDTANKNFKNVEASSAEIETELEKLGANKEDFSDPSAVAAMQDQIVKSESKAQEMIDELAEADKKLADAKKLNLPAWYQDYLELLIKRDAAAAAALDALINGLTETRKLIGSTTLVIDAVNRQAAAIGAADAAVTAGIAGDYAGAQAQLAAADGSLIAAEAALKKANEDLKSQDIDDLISLNQDYRELLVILSKLITAIQAGDIGTATKLITELEAKYAELEAQSSTVGADSDFAAWIESVATKYLDTAEAKMKEATSLDSQAANMYKKNAA